MLLQIWPAKKTFKLSAVTIAEIGSAKFNTRPVAV